MPRLLCFACASRKAISGYTFRSTSSNLRNRAIASSCSARNTTSSSDLEAERESARKRAWYLEESPSSPSSSSSTPQLPSLSRQPNFTTFNPFSTLPLPLAPSAPPRPLPSNAPNYFRALHAFLTTSTDVIDPSSVVFLHTPSARAVMDTQEELGVGGTGARWEWVVVGVVKGRGKGVVGRAERAVRIWVSLYLWIGWQYRGKL